VAGRGAVVFVHGLWLTGRCWEGWLRRYAEAGFSVAAPAWPGMEIEVEALRANPSAMDGLGIAEIADHYEAIIRGLDTKPIIVGHSLGGTITQILLDRGLGAAGVAIHPAPVKGVAGLPFSALRAALPVLGNPANRNRTVRLSPEQFHFGFASTLDEDGSLAAYERYHVPAPGRPLFQVATANLRRDPPTKVDFGNEKRAPLLLIGGGRDNTVPVSLVRETFKRQRRSQAVTELSEFPERDHWTVGAPGWEEVADHALEWAIGALRDS
jgi:pimeloyl-ACP methyl ester carboxylesterase